MYFSRRKRRNSRISILYLNSEIFAYDFMTDNFEFITYAECKLYIARALIMIRFIIHDIN